MSVIMPTLLLVVCKVEDALLYLAFKGVIKNRLLFPTFIQLLVLGPSNSLHAVFKVVNQKLKADQSLSALLLPVINIFLVHYLPLLLLAGHWHQPSPQIGMFMFNLSWSVCYIFQGNKVQKRNLGILLIISQPHLR